MTLKPCPYRHVDDDGHIFCDKIKTGDREISPNLCRACPVTQIHCTHLRAALEHQAHPPLTVRYGHGRTEIWDDPAPSLILQRAACAAKVTPIHSPRDCTGCALHQVLVVADDSAHTAVVRSPLRSPRILPQTTVPCTPTVELARPEPERPTNVVAQKIIQLQDWLAKQSKDATSKQAEDLEYEELPVAIGSRRPSPRRIHVAEEKRVGWTD